MHLVSKESVILAKFPLKSLRFQIRVAIILICCCWCQSTTAQSIIAAPDGTQTVVTPYGNQWQIQGGQLSSDGRNLFHSFQEFGLQPGEVANFLSSPTITNILGRVVGGNASVIQGLIEVTGGNSHLFLMNPAGIIFSQNAQLNVPGTFVATTANAIGFGDQRWFEGTGINDWQGLVGEPSQFRFDSLNPGTVINAGTLTVNSGETLGLIGGSVINTGTLQAPGGQILVMAVPGESLIRLSQPGHLLSVELTSDILPSESQEVPVNLPLTLPKLLTGETSVDEANAITLNSLGKITLTQTGETLPLTPGTSLISGTVSVSDPISPAPFSQVLILGNRIGLIEAEIEASGMLGGGLVRIGGDTRGQGMIPTASRTFVSADSTIRAHSFGAGNGGRVIVWGNELTGFYGQVIATGMSAAGDQHSSGGVVEVSGKDQLIFAGDVNVGTDGTLLLDPKTIRIESSGTDDDQLNINVPMMGSGAGAILFEDSPTVDFTISATALANQTGNIILEAQEDIIFNEPVSLMNPGQSLSATANRRLEVNEPITTAGGTLELRANGSVINEPALAINANLNAQGGDILLTGTAEGGGNQNHGVAVLPRVTVSTTGTGEIRVNGNSGNGIQENQGIHIQETLRAENGGITLTGTGRGSGILNHGIVLMNQGKIETTGAGDINLTGVSEAGENSTGNNDGIALGFGAMITATGTGNLTLSGTSGRGSDNQDGIVLSAGSEMIANDGRIEITGVSRGTGGDNNRGIVLSSDSLIRAVNQGGSLTGTGGAGTSNQSGILIDSSQIEAGGNFTVNGTSQVATGSNNHGIVIQSNSRYQQYGHHPGCRGGAGQ